MDIIDIMLARAMTPQGQTDIYVNKANKAAEKAEKAEQDAAAAIESIEAAADTISSTQEAAAELLETAQEVLETAQEAQINTLDTEDVDAEVKKMTVNTNVVSGQNANTLQVITTYPDNTLNTQNITKLYKSTGNNEDGGMTQKAITDALDTKVNTTILNDYATKTYVTNIISNIPSGGGGNSTITLNVDDAGHIVAVDENGNIIASQITEEDLINALLNSSNYASDAIVGLDIDYENKSFTRVQAAASLSMGESFNKFIMYGGRTRCNVADDGAINAFYGEQGYADDGSNGQVMIYQPKFYYKRLPSKEEYSVNGRIIRHESLLLSATQQPGFKLAPIFAGDLDYVLLPAYDGALINSKLASVAGATPLTNITISAAEGYAQARGEGWHIVNIAAEATNQMLEIVEFGMMNGQTALEQGIVDNPANNSTCYFITGSTANLGNETGHASSTQVSINGNISTQTEDGKRAISYRGMENPWGNLWQMIGGVNIYGDGTKRGGLPYICTDFNYTPSTIGSNYEDIGFTIPGTNKWQNAMGLGDNSKYDWIFMPIECSSSATSLLPIGDGLWATNSMNGIKMLASGGSYGFGDECGPFYYALDRDVNDGNRPNYGVKLMYIPTKNATYTANIAKWSTYMGG